MQKQNKNAVLVLLIIATLLFLIVVRDYIIPIVLAAIVAGLLQPSYKWLLTRFKGKKSLTSMVITFVFLLIIVIPSIFFIVLVYNQAAGLSQSLSPVIEGQAFNSDFLNQSLPDWFPFNKQLEPFKTNIFQKINELIGHLGTLFMQGLGNLTQGTLVFFINLFILLYALYYFLISNNALKQSIYKIMPLSQQQTQVLITKTLSISRATLKGALLVGIVQGFLVGLSLWAAGFEEPLFWGTLAAIMSLIPSIGCAIVYVPAGVYLILTGQTTAGIGVLIWGFGVVSSVDNFLRPKLVGKDTELPDLIVLISTLGGIGMFGLSGIVLGPIIAGLFIAIVDIYGTSYSVK